MIRPQPARVTDLLPSICLETEDGEGYCCEDPDNEVDQICFEYTGIETFMESLTSD